MVKTTQEIHNKALPDLLMDLLVCPVCKGDLDLTGTAEKPMLSCMSCRLLYPIEDGIPVMLSDQAIPHSPA